MSTDAVDIAWFLVIFFGPISLFAATCRSRERAAQRAGSRRFGRRS